MAIDLLLWSVSTICLWKTNMYMQQIYIYIYIYRTCIFIVMLWTYIWQFHHSLCILKNVSFCNLVKFYRNFWKQHVHSSLTTCTTLIPLLRSTNFRVASLYTLGPRRSSGKPTWCHAVGLDFRKLSPRASRPLTRWFKPWPFYPLFVLGSKLPLIPYMVGDGHQPNSRGLYTHYNDSY